MGQARQAVERLVEVYDRHDPAQVVALYATGAKISRPGAPELTPETLGQFYGGFVQAMPDFRHILHNVVEEGDRAAFECAIEATFTGSLPTPEGAVSGNGAHINFTHAQFITIDEQGRIIEDRDYTDMAHLMSQIGMGAAQQEPVGDEVEAHA
ncbi:MAG: hypothetical protein DLM70_08940 [Chloroflexi bacterium]|nr:MAG: hypothetical protein DLM70_08940 [Chloroflexota bacterium]